ncbi:MAG: hypothetical protein RL189_3065 [Pseudomonadota bacterium]
MLSLKTFLQRTPNFCMAAMITLGSLSAEALACRCRMEKSATEALGNSDAVFLGLVTRNELDKSERMITMKVKRWVKGGDSPEVAVYTYASSASCGVNLTKGESYLVYAKKDPKKKNLRTTGCDRTRSQKRAEAEGDLKELEEKKSP